MSFVLAVLLASAPPPRPPQDIAASKALLARTCRPELSGLAWVASLARYLAVSDDTGLLETTSWHAPWLFTVDEQGAFDEEPLVIEGLDALDDAESITPGPKGTFFLTTSHARNKKGQAKPARRQLLWLALEGRKLSVRGRLDLTEAKDTKGQDLTALITGEEDELDIEAITFRDGALFVGFKAPLDAKGRAAIVRIEKIVEAFAAKQVDPKSISIWARPLLEVPGPDGAATPEGVTDLLFLADGRLVLAANAPKSGKPDGGGALWLLAKPEAKPVMLHRFEGLKPEGLTFSPDGKRIVVAFDRGQDPSQWVQVPLPD